MGISDNPEGVAFTHICREPEGDVLRTVRFVTFTPDNLKKLWEKVSKFPTFMGAEIRDFNDMLKVFIDDSDGTLRPKGLCLVVDDFVGIFYLTDINGIFEASVHYTFFDRRHKGRLDLCKKALKFAFETFQFHRLTTSVPEYATDVNFFVKTIGFTKVGVQRKNKFFKGKLYNNVLYDILAEELDGIRELGLQESDRHSTTTSEPAKV